MTKNPGTARSVKVLPGATAKTCDVAIEDEGITLNFMRGDNNRIRVLGRQFESNDTPRRASSAGYAQAASLADATMRAYDSVIQERESTAPSNILILDSSSVECTLGYLGHHLTYEVQGGERTMLTWEILRLKLQKDGRLIKTSDELPVLTEREKQVLKQRALTVIQSQRGRMGYGAKGRGMPQNLGQLPLFSTTRQVAKAS